MRRRAQRLLLRAGGPFQQHVPQTLRLWTWLFYFSLGGLLGGGPVRARLVAALSPRRAALLLAASAALVLAWEFGFGYHVLSFGSAEYFYDDPATMLWSFAVFAACDAGFVCSRRGGAARIIERLAPLTMGIYVTHAFARLVVAHFYDLSCQPLNFTLVPAVFVSCAAVTYALTSFKATRRLVSL